MTSCGAKSCFSISPFPREPTGDVIYPDAARAARYSPAGCNHARESKDGDLRSKRAGSDPRQRLEAFEGQALGVGDAGEIEAADERDDSVAVAIGQRDDGVDRDFLGFHWAHLGLASNPGRDRLGLRG